MQNNNYDVRKTLTGLFKTILFAISVFAWTAASVAAQKDESGGVAQQYEVTVTNITANQVLTPVIAASHISDVSIFTLGEAASVELEDLAESGNLMPLANVLMNTDGVRDVFTVDAPLPPGGSLTFELSTRGLANRISIAAMLVPTNDAFFALNGAEIKPGNASRTFYAVAYDAGTEFNDEDCDRVPGPPNVCTGEGFNPSREGAEGSVHVHRGIHGILDIADETYDWRNPVAKITITRVK